MIQRTIFICDTLNKVGMEYRISFRKCITLTHLSTDNLIECKRFCHHLLKDIIKTVNNKANDNYFSDDCLYHTVLHWMYTYLQQITDRDSPSSSSTQKKKKIECEWNGLHFFQNNTHLRVIITSFYQQWLCITCNYMLYFFLLAFVCSLSIKWFDRSYRDEMAQTSHQTYQRYIYHGNNTNLKVSLSHRIH